MRILQLEREVRDLGNSRVRRLHPGPNVFVIRLIHFPSNAVTKCDFVLGIKIRR